MNDWGWRERRTPGMRDFVQRGLRPLAAAVPWVTVGLLFMTIPYSEGWSAKVDGEECEITPVGDSFVGIMLSKGTHTVEFNYKPHGLTEGTIVTVVSIVVMAGIVALTEVKRRKREVRQDEKPT